ncbi:PREDICTED: uncharacterized protein LOC109176400 [Ipomoea nil]|uniref:uncharacterized protein LOC109176400 n=1 Tax=Ipomoea nil TaxID=35883 RepID=UPI0009011A87|nr:PREDICTED: uncharacterized protein LOC109176400 [Ipomoea nil]
MVIASVRRRIGNGKTTLIWGHRWLLDDPSPLIQTNMPEELRSAKVAGLIDEQTTNWDPHILADLFVDEDVSRILKIPISPDYDDSWYWLGDPNGIYIVKNAYRNIMGTYEHTPREFDKWITIWKMRVPPKWKTFLWRAICDILPTTTNLIIKRVEIDPTCQMCVLAHENVMHTLVSYEQTGVMVALLYHLWRTRNSAVWDGALPRPVGVWRTTAANYSSFRKPPSAVHSP